MAAISGAGQPGFTNRDQFAGELIVELRRGREARAGKHSGVQTTIGIRLLVKTNGNIVFGYDDFQIHDSCIFSACVRAGIVSVCVQAKSGSGGFSWRSLCHGRHDTRSKFYHTSAYTFVAFASVEYDTSGLMDKANYQQFIVPAGVSKVRLKCGFIWSASNPSLRTQMVITKTI